MMDMKTTTFLTAAVLFLTPSAVMAGGGAPVPETPEAGPPAGRPTAILDESKCAEVWKKAKDKPAGYMVNFELADADGNGEISKAEFKKGCKKGWVQKHATLPVKSGGGQTPKEPTQ